MITNPHEDVQASEVQAINSAMLIYNNRETVNLDTSNHFQNIQGLNPSSGELNAQLVVI